MSPNDGLETLVNHLHDTPPIVLSILQLFKVTKPFVAGIYHYPDKKQYPSSDFVEDWQDFIDVSSPISHRDKLINLFTLELSAVCDIRVGDQKDMHACRHSGWQYVAASYHPYQIITPNCYRWYGIFSTELLDVLAFATQDEPNFPVVMAKVEDYMRVSTSWFCQWGWSPSFTTAWRRSRTQLQTIH